MPQTHEGSSFTAATALRRSNYERCCEDILLLAEGSDTTLAYDRNVKLPMYAGASIPEIWIVDLQGEAVEVHAAPERGRYIKVNKHRRGEELRSETMSDLSLCVEEILG